jgi:hypothetical protein
MRSLRHHVAKIILFIKSWLFPTKTNNLLELTEVYTPEPSFNAADLHVISVISNPMRYKRRSHLFREFLRRMDKCGATVWVVEATFGERKPEIVCHDANHTIRVRCDDEVWLKENLINVAARHLPADAKYLMWLDADVEFDREDWVMETLEALQHHPVVQPFTNIIDLGPNGEVMERHKSFAYCYVEGDKLSKFNKLGGWLNYGKGPYWHPGYGFAFRMDTWNALGGMLDLNICGAGDYHMACALIGQVEFSRPGNIHENYKLMLDAWQRRAEIAVRRDIGYVTGTIRHYYHGTKKNRRYRERWDILTKNDFDPFSDVHYDRHGVLHLAPATDARTRRLRDQLRDYFAERKEDE